MKHKLFLSLVVLGTSISGFGSTTFCSSLTTFQDYINAGSCIVPAQGGGSNYTLNSFTYLGVSLLTSGATPSDIDVTTSVGANGPSVAFTLDSAIGQTLLGNKEILFGFDITSGTPEIHFTDVNLAETSALTGLSTGLVAEEDCYGGALPTPTNLLSLGNGGLACLTGGITVGASVGNNLVLGAGNNANANVNLETNQGPVSSVDVLKEISLTGLAGGAQVNSVTQSFQTTVTPEPAAYLLCGCGLIGFALVRPRKAKKQ